MVHKNAPILHPSVAKAQPLSHPLVMPLCRLETYFTGRHSSLQAIQVSLKLCSFRDAAVPYACEIWTQSFDHVLALSVEL
jgi:hypothetical protein